MPNNKTSKHDKGVIVLEHLLSDKHYVLSLETFVEWAESNKCGELDVYTIQGDYKYVCNRYCYYEFKCTDTEQAEKRAKIQGLRWTSTMYKEYPNKLFYSILVAGYDPLTKMFNKVKIISKNDKLRS